MDLATIFGLQQLRSCSGQQWISRIMLKERGQADSEIFMKAGTKQRKNNFHTSKYFEVEDLQRVWRAINDIHL